MMQDVDELNRHGQAESEEDEEEDESSKWEPSGSWWRDFLYFSGPGEVDDGPFHSELVVGGSY